MPNKAKFSGEFNRIKIKTSTVIKVLKIYEDKGLTNLKMEQVINSFLIASLKNEKNSH